MPVAVGGPKPLTDAVKAEGGLVGQRSYWAGAWMLKPTVGYGGLDRFYAGCKADGIEPLVLVWPIGDDDGVKFLTTGVEDQYQKVWKTRQDGLNITREVARRAKAAGVSPVIVLNNEFNKGTLQRSPDFARFYDEQVSIIRTECPGAKVVFPPGAWGDLSALAAYYKPQIDKSDMVGLQCGYFRPRRTDDLARVGVVMAANFSKLPPGKPRILYDAFLSTYGGPFSATHPFAGGDGRALEAQQADAIRGLGQIQGLASIVYRDLRDNPSFDIANYGGWAERFVGVVRGDGTRKPAYDALMAIARPSAPPSEPKTRTESEFAAVVAQRDGALRQRDALAAEVAAARGERDALLAKVAAARMALEGNR